MEQDSGSPDIWGSFISNGTQAIQARQLQASNTSPRTWLELLGIRHFLSPEVAQLVRCNPRYCETYLCHQLDRGYLKVKPEEP